ncbi:MAG TPA: hypothetical protein VMZ90_02040 [Vicinamibacterales bacterium]|nr:hypothetical protein [Vicinamibacterales bacterium]
MLRKTWMFALIAWSLTGTAWAQAVMVTQVTGAVTASGKGGVQPAVPFLKLDEGDKLMLAKNARVQMIYLANGRQEVWKGDGQVEVGELNGRSPSLKAEATQLPASIVSQLKRTPSAGQQGRSGMVMLRSLDDLDASDRLQKEYTDFRTGAAADDTTPEVYLLTGLLDLKEYEWAKKVLGDLKNRQLTQPAYEAVVDHFGPLVERASASSKD